MDFNPLKYVSKIMITAVFLFLFGTLFTFQCNKDVIKTIKNIVPEKVEIKPKNVSRETQVKTLYLIDGKEVSQEDYLKWVNEQDKKKTMKQSKGLKFTGSGKTRSTSKGDISYGNGR